MPNEEIISALRNAIDHGDSLQSAVQIMINSGYDPNEVQEASKFIGGISSMQEPTPEEQLTIPEEKNNFSSKFKFWAKNKPQDKTSQSIQTQQLPFQQPLQQSQQLRQQLPQYSQQPIQQAPQQPQQLPQYSQQITQAQIKQSFQHPQQPLQQLSQQQFQQPMQQTIPQHYRPPPRPPPHLITRQGTLSREIKKIKPERQSYAKEIILLIILLILIGVLAATIFFKDKILVWFG